MDEINVIFTRCPYYGKRRMSAALKRNGFPVGVKKDFCFSLGLGDAFKSGLGGFKALFVQCLFGAKPFNFSRPLGETLEFYQKRFEYFLQLPLPVELFLRLFLEYLKVCAASSHSLQRSHELINLRVELAEFSFESLFLGFILDVFHPLAQGLSLGPGYCEGACQITELLFPAQLQDGLSGVFGILMGRLRGLRRGGKKGEEDTSCEQIDSEHAFSSLELVNFSFPMMVSAR
jgi:hypothetical protein